ncbi:MAG: efflux RND transporter periplasmic adaptor subunit [Planctomycetota bacterium]|nr:efflux RND transporter periplasmic adaptor subunit [Planctomycetota bacterium]
MTQPSHQPPAPAPTPAPARAHGEEHSGPDEASLPRIRTPAILGLVLVLLLFLGALFLLGWLPRQEQDKLLKEDLAHAKSALPLVDIAKPVPQGASSELLLPGDTTAMQETAVFTRANGYLKSQTVDIGDHVKEGDLLAEIDSPEVDADVNQSNAALAQAKAAVAQAQASVTKAASDRQLAQDTFDRYASYAKSGGVTKQVLDERKAAVDQAKAAYDVAQAAATAAEASVGAAQALVKRAADLQGFEKVSAPFSGTITARNYDKGSLLSAANTGAGREMFRIVQDDPLRVFVNVPQAHMAMVAPGMPADLTVRNFPGRTFPGKVVRSTRQVDTATRTVRFEIHVDNKDHALIAGMYGQVRFRLSQERPLLTVPSSALMFEPDGMKVAVVQEGKARFKRVDIGRDLGARVEIAEGLCGDDDVVVNPGQRLADGVAVEIVTKPPPALSNATPPVGPTAPTAPTRIAESKAPAMPEEARR